jgi:glycosyltransferase involved in cell wall biosynthesis
MAAAGGADVLLVSLGATGGLRRADDELADSLRRAGANVAIARPAAPRPLPTLMLTDLQWARAARKAAAHAEREGPARAIVYSTTTAALLWQRPGAIRFDATAAGNRPGRHGLWQRPREQLRLGEAPLLLPWSDGGLREAPAAARRGDRTLVVPVPVESSGPASGARDIAAITYAANPHKKGFDRVLAAWRRLRAAYPDADYELVVAGASAEQLQHAGLATAGEPGVRVVGELALDDFRALLRRARVFVCAPRREDYGLVQLEALADGCRLVTSAAPGPYAALSLARQLDARLVGDDLATALSTALDDPRADYAEHAREGLLPYTRQSVDRIVAEQLLPRLLA